ncbi:exodeoxyribonuclease V subunit beta [Marinobacterium rhizophilum]|uniref:RecBCD enzyme subunit RecB n=1 Tax=Marinobacterium rhizophilum TaxID=420402 RepID=A0ABY5HNF0_9GAMM|nr:exodeoxyribonuclease V subunit beta [Marinobacterium rhizophilum]UTW13823.1 exodeoxyribonuclease V subunit beta [Marinobacterium rhizophilum]
MAAHQILNPLSFPLHAMRLIEASAGTGKTYTIAALYLRLLLGHGAEGAAHARALDVDEILVVTFTEAATEELRDRVRARIQEARRAFMRGASGDAFIQGLLDDTPDHGAAARLLGDAARSMDQAAIFTIHGFCQRMLKQHAFESGSLFDTELEQDDAPLLHEAMLDYWRQRLYTLPDALADEVLQLWSEPARLLKDIRPHLATDGLRLLPDLAGVSLLELWQEQDLRVAAFKQAWRHNSDDLLALVQAADLNGTSYRKASIPGWLGSIDDYCASSQVLPDSVVLKNLQRFCQSQLRAKTKKNGVTPEHALFEQLEVLCESWAPLRELLLTEALHEVRRRLALNKQQRRVQGFDDLLSGLDKALVSSAGERLALAIRAQYPVALIDEFQDTDPQQYRIFSTLYADAPQSGLFMIGDPKQAIYAFRGADIFTYIQARRAVADHYTLETNWRSGQAMVDAVNRLFARHDAPFIYDEDIPFVEVRAAAHADKKPLRLRGERVPALTLWHLAGDPMAKGDYLAHFAASCASQVVTLLAGEACLGERPLEAADLAILVRDRYEAAAVQRELQRRNVPSVYQSGRDSVFSTQEAVDLYRILQAVQEPQQERFLRTALASGLLLQDAVALNALNEDERCWETLVAEFMAYHQRWENLGVLATVHQLLERRDLAQALLALPGGERRLTDLLHLAELLQEASQQLDGMPGLMRWFGEHLQNPNGGSAAQQLRLESDRNRVTLVTIHKSKGLEYPVVLLPFPVSHRVASTAIYHDEANGTVLDLGGGQDALEQADAERLAEDLRLLYVALTRSVHACYLGIADLRSGAGKKSVLAGSALGYLLLRGEKPEALRACLEDYAQVAGIVLSEPPLHTDSLPPQADEAAVLQARPFRGRIARDWRIASYSGLSSHGHGRTLNELPGLDLEVVAEADMPTAAVPQADIFSFPKGARAGTFLHGLFEQLDFPAARDSGLAQVVQERLQLEGYDALWQPVLEQLVADVLDAPLDDSGLCLRCVPAADRLVELEFMLPVAGLDCRALNRLLAEGDALSAKAGLLQFDRVQGMLKGFVDLVFRVDGRYYIADYKSNHLGQETDSYARTALESAMLEHRYDLQYQLYTLALHRLLRQRLPDYDYDTHMGGAFYLFLRGMRAGDKERPGVFHRRPARALVEALDRLFDGQPLPVEG